MTPFDLVLAFAALNVLDILLTLFVLDRGGVELNRVLVKWFAKDDADVVLVRVKVALLSLIYLGTWFGLLPLWALWALVAVYTGLFAWNLRSFYLILKKTS